MATHPWQIFQSRSASVKELAAPFDISAPAVTKHLKVLERAGLITRGRTAQWRPCRLAAAPLRDVAEWVEHYRRFWDESLDRPAAPGAVVGTARHDEPGLRSGSAAGRRFPDRHA
jgi:DNA-binding transcriptional ArsR family regulator